MQDIASVQCAGAWIALGAQWKLCFQNFTLLDNPSPFCLASLFIKHMNATIYSYQMMILLWLLSGLLQLGDGKIRGWGSWVFVLVVFCFFFFLVCFFRSDEVLFWYCMLLILLWLMYVSYLRNYRAIGVLTLFLAASNGRA